MASVATSLAAALPKPKYTGEHEEIPTHAQPKGTRVVGPGVLDNSQIVLRKTGPPAYGSRHGWRPRIPEDYGDGGAFPEVHVAQYPLDMGRKTGATSNALALQVDGEGKVKYDAIARRGHGENRIVHTSFKDLIPLRQQANAGEISLAKPSDEAVAEQTEKTKNALAALVSGAVAAQKPKNVQGLNRDGPTYVSYTPADQMGDASKQDNTRILKIVQRQRDPMEPPKFKHKKIPRGPPSPPPPVLHSPPRRLTAEDQEAWRIPPPISNWKNPKGYTVPLDKRLAADGRGLQDVTINDKFAQFAEALFTADRHAREEVRQRATMQQRLAEKEKEQKEEHLRLLAQQARDARVAQTRGPSRRYSGSRSSSRSRSYSRSGSESGSEDSNASGRREREAARRERRAEHERKLRQKNMGATRKMQVLAREADRDISEKVALGLAKPSAQGDALVDSRLFGQSSGFDSGFNEDQPYDKPLFARQEAINSIYRPAAQGQDDEELGEEAAGEQLDKIGKANRFEVLGKAAKGFRGAAEAEPRTGPVLFERDKDDDPFKINDLIRDATGGKSSAGAGGKRYGMQEGEGRASKRARVEDDN